MAENEDVLELRDAAAYLKVNEQTLRRFAREGGVPAFKLGRRWRFRRSSLDAWSGSQEACQRAEAILVVDDDPAILALASRILANEGVRVLTAREAVEALAPKMQTVYAQMAADLQTEEKLQLISFLKRFNDYHANNNKL